MPAAVALCQPAVGQAAQATSTSSDLVAAVLPESRSAVVGGTVTAFATIINSGGTAATSCAISPQTSVPATFVYQTTDPTTNALTGTANTPVTIAAGGSQSFVFALTATDTFAPADLALNFGCTNELPAPVFPGLNTLLYSASASPVPDIVALAATPGFNSNGTLILSGVTGTPGCAGCGLNAFAIATINLGSSDTITAVATASPSSLPLTLTICANGSFGVCAGGPGSQTPTVTVPIASKATPTFGVFAAGTGAIPFAPQTNRIIVQFIDSSGAVRGQTSVAIRD